MARKKRHDRDRRGRDRDQPEPDWDDLVEWGGQLIWPAGFTAGGAPYGLSLHEYLDAIELASPRADWAVARRVLREVLTPTLAGDAHDAIGRVRFLGDGLSYTVF